MFKLSIMKANKCKAQSTERIFVTILITNKCCSVGLFQHTLKYFANTVWMVSVLIGVEEVRLVKREV